MIKFYGNFNFSFAFKEAEHIKRVIILSNTPTVLSLAEMLNIGLYGHIWCTAFHV